MQPPMQQQTKKQRQQQSNHNYYHNKISLVIYKQFQTFLLGSKGTRKKKTKINNQPNWAL